MDAGLTPPKIAEALDQSAHLVEELRQQLPAHRRGRAADDLFLLRYALSYGGASPAAAAAAAKALDWRDEHPGLVAAARVCTDEKDSSPLKEWISEESLQVIDRCLVASFAGYTGTPKDFPLYVINSGRSKLRRLMDEVAVDDVALWLTWRNEIGYWRCDTLSRISGTLVKQIVVMSMEGAYMSGQDPRFFVAYGKASKRAEYLHPQLLARQIVVHPPAFMSYFWALGRRLVSERTLAKVHVHDGQPAEYLARYFERGIVPKVVVDVLREGTDDVGVADAEAKAPEGQVDSAVVEAAARWVKEVATDDGLNTPLPAHFSDRPEGSS